MLRIPAPLAVALLVPAGLSAQDPHILPDARLPRPGEVWIELSPALLSWSDRFAADGRREPLATDFDGSILSRTFPALDGQVLADLNADADALGFDPFQADDLSAGGLRFGTLNIQTWRALAALRIGILDRVAVELAAPIAFTDVEPLFAWDPATATVVRASAALTDGPGFLAAMDGARATLEGLVNGGTLSPEAEATARELLDASGAFADALRARIEADRFLPLAGSTAGAQLLARFDSLSQGFAGFAVALPTLQLLESATAADLEALFTSEPLRGALPGRRKSPVSVGEVEVGVLLGLLDSSREQRRPLRLRTTVGARLRVPLRRADRPPFQDRSDPFFLPIGDGQRDLELAIYQDLWLGRSWRWAAAGRFGIQAADRLRVRVHPPDRPFALPETEAAVRRDLGDYFQLRLAPQYLLNDVISVGLEYGYWRKGADAYRLLEELPGLPDARPLELATRESRHRLGIGVFYRPGEGRRPVGTEPRAGAGGDEPEANQPRRREADRTAAWRLGVAFQWAVAGSGGRTPASGLLTATFRIPFRPF